MFDNIKKKLGFGFMRLPKIDEKLDYEKTKEMVDYFIQNGFNYFDTAHGYHEGKSELAIKECLTKRYPRNQYILTNKLTDSFFTCKEDIRPLFKKQLEACGVDYFDFYLMHAQNAKRFEFFKKCHAYEEAFTFQKEGKIKHVGLSFHDTADVLDNILTQYPQIEVVQIQLNYLDYDNPSVQSKKCLDVCIKHKKPIIIMEPVKGGNLVNLPIEANNLLKSLNNGSNASYAIRFAASQENVFMVLSGMSNMEQVIDNTSFMKEFIPINLKEQDAISQVVEIFKKQHMIACTGCQYCVEGCPKKIAIPHIFADYNAKKVFNDWNSSFYYNLHTKNNNKASDCIKCGKCENICPQNLKIRELLKTVAETFETND